MAGSACNSSAAQRQRSVANRTGHTRDGARQRGVTCVFVRVQRAPPSDAARSGTPSAASSMLTSAMRNGNRGGCAAAEEEELLLVRADVAHLISQPPPRPRLPPTTLSSPLVCRRR